MSSGITCRESRFPPPAPSWWLYFVQWHDETSPSNLLYPKTELAKSWPASRHGMVGCFPASFKKAHAVALKMAERDRTD